MSVLVQVVHVQVHRSAQPLDQRTLISPRVHRQQLPQRFIVGVQVARRQQVARAIGPKVNIRHRPGQLKEVFRFTGCIQLVEHPGGIAQIQVTGDGVLPQQSGETART